MRKLYEEAVATIVDLVSADLGIKSSPPCMVGLEQNLSVSVLFIIPKKYIGVYFIPLIILICFCVSS